MLTKHENILKVIDGKTKTMIKSKQSWKETSDRDKSIER